MPKAVIIGVVDLDEINTADIEFSNGVERLFTWVPGAGDDDEANELADRLITEAEHS